jgi:DNA mismatch endonuclease, patch repair protein
VPREANKRKHSPRLEGRSPVERPRIQYVDAETSQRMAGVRQRDTKAECIVRRAAHALGLRFRVRNRDLPGSPDLANRARRWAVFVHGCFWHRHPGCSRTTTPKRNRSFWVAKFDANGARDRRVISALREMRFRTLIIWECEVLGARSRLRLNRRLALLVDRGD